MQKVTIIGLGYVGLPLAFSVVLSKKYNVFGFDLNKEMLQNLINNKSHIKDEIVQNAFEQKQIEIIDFENVGNNDRCSVHLSRDLSLHNINVQTQNLTVSSKQEILNDTDIFVICVPTPVYKDHTPDLQPVIRASESIAKFLKKGALVIMESTVNPGVCDEIVIPILEKTGLKVGVDFYFAYCPERINPGDTNWNVLNIPRNLGASDNRSLDLAFDFYSSWLQSSIKKVSSIKIAEASKIVENTFRDINIAFVNELAKSFDLMQIDLIEVLESASNKPFAFMPHWPSCGVGGHCIPVDPYYLIKRADIAGFDHKFLKIARDINNSMPEYTVKLCEDLIKSLNVDLQKVKIGLYGLSYKKDIADIRESPALEILELLQQKYTQNQIFVFDPYVLEQSNFNNIQDFLQNIDVLIIATNHLQITNLAIQDFANVKIKIIIDGKNCLNKNQIELHGIKYKGIGR